MTTQPTREALLAAMEAELMARPARTMPSPKVYAAAPKLAVQLLRDHGSALLAALDGGSPEDKRARKMAALAVAQWMSATPNWQYPQDALRILLRNTGWDEPLPAPPMVNDLVERLNLTSLKEWFIRGPNGGFHKDDAPFEAAAAITRLTDEVAGLRAKLDSAMEVAATAHRDIFMDKQAAEARVAALEGLVKKCADQFRYYEASHRAKGTPDATMKAEVNRHIADVCEAALAQAGSKP